MENLKELLNGYLCAGVMVDYSTKIYRFFGDMHIRKVQRLALINDKISIVKNDGILEFYFTIDKKGRIKIGNYTIEFVNSEIRDLFRVLVKEKKYTKRGEKIYKESIN